MRVLNRPWGHLHFHDAGPPQGDAVLFINSLGTDLRMWDAVTARLPDLRLVRFDKRGHGLSGTPDGAWNIDELSDDAVALLDHLGLDRCLIAGCSVGGLIAQALALRHPTRVSALLLSNTAARIGTPYTWQARIDAVATGGMDAVAPAVLARWFTPTFLDRPEAKPWEVMLRRCDPLGYMATCAALAPADLSAEVPRIACPTLCLAGSEDQATPPDLVRATANLIPGARLAVLEGSGHLPAIDAPEETARHLLDLLEGIDD